MDQASRHPGQAPLTRRGQVVAAAARWISLAVGLLALLAAWDDPTTRRTVALFALLGYAGFNLASQLYQRQRPRARDVKILHDVVDALAVGVGAFASGGLASPIWLLLYPHVAAVSVRGGLRLAMSIGLLDAAIVAFLAGQSPLQPLGVVHSFALLFCAFMGGTTSAHLSAVKDRLALANRSLQEKNEQHRRLLERIQDGVVIIQDAKVAYANQVFGEMVGAPPETLVGTDFLELVPREDRPDISSRYARWEETQAVSGVLEVRILSRDGTVLLTSLRAGSAEFGGGRAVIATIRDVTGQRRMEEDVKAHALRLAAINEIANAINQNLTIEDICTVVARETRPLLPFDRLTIALLEEAGGSVQVVPTHEGAAPDRASIAREEVDWAFRYPVSWCEGSPESAPPGLRELLREPGARAIVTVPLLAKDRVIGSLNLGRTEARPFGAADQQILAPVARHLALAIDNARLLDAVRRRGNEFESLLEVGRGIVARLDLQELLPLVTRSVNRVMGTRHCLLLLHVGHRLEVAAHEGLEPEVVASFRGLRVGSSLSGSVLRDGKPLAVADMLEDPRLQFTEMVRRFGYRSFLGVPLRRGTEIMGTLEVVTKHETRTFGAEEQTLMTAFADQAAVAIDNARLFEEARRHLDSVVRANQQLEDLDRMRRQYLRNTSHEFRTPLTVIKGYAEFLAHSEDPAPASVRTVMKIVLESCERVIDMVETLIDVSRIEQESPERELELQALDLREIAEASTDTLRPLAEKKNIAMEILLPREALPMQADRGLIHQVVRKLVENALKYSSSGGRVVVRATAGTDDLCLEVEDFGLGIPEEHLSRIFEKFYMVDGSVTRRTGGTGVGLYLVQEIVRLHRGRLSVESTPGRGSRFRVTLPRALTEHRPAARARG